tara:strand:- start:25 stop:177 length:153 start_codon:yes stop_codon:yes gene_type:complete
MDKYTYLGIDTIEGYLIGEDKITENEFFKYHYNPKEYIDVETLDNSVLNN